MGDEGPGNGHGHDHDHGHGHGHEQRITAATAATVVPKATAVMATTATTATVDGGDLEHLFGGSDMSTAVKALYESGAPQEFFANLERY